MKTPEFSLENSGVLDRQKYLFRFQRLNVTFSRLGGLYRAVFFFQHFDQIPTNTSRFLGEFPFLSPPPTDTKNVLNPVDDVSF
jgi:hypothetical protein